MNRSSRRPPANTETSSPSARTSRRPPAPKGVVADKPQPRTSRRPPPRKSFDDFMPPKPARRHSRRPPRMLTCLECDEPLKNLAFGGEPEDPNFGLQIRAHALDCKPCRLMFIEEWFKLFHLKKGDVDMTPEKILKMSLEQILQRQIVIQNVGDYKHLKID